MRQLLMSVCDWHLLRSQKLARGQVCAIVGKCSVCCLALVEVFFSPSFKPLRVLLSGGVSVPRMLPWQSHQETTLSKRCKNIPHLVPEAFQCSGALLKEKLCRIAHCP
jgi:hypothetical protein